MLDPRRNFDAGDTLGEVLNAALFAAHKHRDQRRKDAAASPYINHPIQLANVLRNEGGVGDPLVLCAALLHDTLEDTDTTHAELVEAFGEGVAAVVLEVTDDTNLLRDERKRLQIERAPGLSRAAKLVRLADKICNLRDVADNPPRDWSMKRRREYFDWGAQVVDGLRGVHPGLEGIFDQILARGPG